MSNSPPNPSGPRALEHAGLAGHFERQFSVASVRAFKPSQTVYRMVAGELSVAPADCCLVACHVWDTIGAQSTGLSAGLITRPGNAPLAVPGLPQADFVAPDLPALASRLIEFRRS